MKDVTFQAPNKVEVKEVDDPKIEKQDDIIVRITLMAICGSDLHLKKQVPHHFEVPVFR